MHGPTCNICDRGDCKLSKRDWCDICEYQFESVMSTIKCEEDNTRHAASVCTSPISCMMRKTCVQLRAAIEIIRHESDNRITETEHDTREIKR